MFQRMMSVLSVAGLVLSLTVALSASSAIATTIGPGMGITDAVDFDTAGEERLNVDASAFVSLAPGTYAVDDFGLNVFTHDAGVGGSGTITPMLLVGAPANYTTLWVGPGYDPSANGVQTVAYAAGSEQFTLTAAANVYGGIFTTNQGSAIIGLDQNNSGTGGSSTDHDNSFAAPTGPGEAVGGFSNTGLGRTYAFEVNISSNVAPPVSALIGPGAATAGSSADGSGGRTNIEQDFVSLAAGAYNVQDFAFHALNTNGTVLPFLAARTTPGPNQRYTPIWVGSAVVPTGAGTNTEAYFVGNEQFILTATTDVYAGFVMTDNAVGFFGGGATEHTGSALTPVIGSELDLFSHNNLGRSYSFGINVAEVPEPATISLLTVGLLGLLRRRRYRPVISNQLVTT